MYSVQTVKIGILDEEKEYVEALAGYLGRFAKGRWAIAAFTDPAVLYSYLQDGKIDILAGTDRAQLERVRQEYEGLIFLWLSDEKKLQDNIFGDATGHMPVCQSVCRYQSAKVIAMAVQNIVEQRYLTLEGMGKMVAVYSPVGRCGKTSLALEVVQREDYGRWLYIGMEDYSSFPAAENNITMEEFLYYVKERQGEKLLGLMEESGGMIVSGRLIFDVRQITKEDMQWIRPVLLESNFDGMVFDIGTGVLQNYEIFSAVDDLVVPYLSEGTAMIKKQNFESGLDVLGMAEIKEKIRFVNMECQQEIVLVMEEIFK